MTAADTDTIDETPTILIVGEDALCSDFQQHFAGRGVTIQFAGDTPSAITRCVSQPPRLLVLPVAGLGEEFLSVWSRPRAPAAAILGLVESLGDPVPEGYTRTARRGQPKEIVSLSELMLRSLPVTPPASGGAKPAPPASLSIWNRPGGILANVPEPDQDQDEEAVEEESDPARLHDLRSLGVALRMARTLQDSGPTPHPVEGSSGSLKLSHAGGGSLEPGPTDSKVSDAMADLPKPRAAQDTMQRLKAISEEEVPSAPTATPEEVKKKQKAEGTQLLIKSKSRRGVVVGAVILVVLTGAGVAGWVAWSSYAEKKRQAAAGGTPSDRVLYPVVGGDSKRGTLMDPITGTIAVLPQGVSPVDVDVRDKALNRSVPELDPYLDKTLRRLSKRKQRETLMAWGERHLKSERYPEARRYLNRAMKLRDGARVRALLSRVHQGLGRTPVAIHHLKFAIRKEKMNGAYRAQLGQLYLEAGKRKKACKAFKAAAKRDPQYKKQVQQQCGKKRARRGKRR